MSAKFAQLRRVREMKIALALLLVAFCNTSCNTDDPPLILNAPGIVPTATPSFGSFFEPIPEPPLIPEPFFTPVPLVAGEEAQLSWKAISLQVKSCDYAGRCDGADGFTIDSSGGYSISQGVSLAGKITHAELANIETAIAQVIAQDPLPSISCSKTAPLPGLSSYILKLTFSSGVETVLQTQQFVAGGLEVCTAGNVDDAARLETEIAILVSKYESTAAQP
ncbi:MAG TPA: hypothetical protein DCS07_10890 [Bdellovibrionales bacterium]|nr:MAG: hypothetical protein A2Z97_02215 [Bdellovibrionales bacterium GWB1_52_6]OFZ04079.1 MAG: hypothetical protein A2X97_14855 [Bdellovibrionales bacterium GWA1_52_35]OFZ41229.1 MAG: hypothetical protein A2070_03875 [Bdellovibrionales bacterium GWC1_52_8]HAR43115.1 hypothetical protein [Bdellovibrionales bacterium]HCM39835.1 hypothetical protein [Bdellovibrionales bacterium]